MRFTVKTKLSLVFLVFFISSVLLGAIGVYALMSVNEKNDQIVNSWMPGLSSTRRLDGYISDYRLLIYRHIGAKTPAETQAREQDMDAVEQKVNEAFAEYEHLIATGYYESESGRKADQDDVNAIKSLWKDYMDAKKEAISLSRQNKTEEALIVQVEKCVPVVMAAKEKLAKIIAYNENGSVLIGKDVTATYENSRLALIVVIVAALLLGSGVIFWIGKSIITAIQKLLAASREIANGNLRVSSGVDTGDELGELAEASDQMVENMKRLISQIQKTSEQVAASSEELTASADQSAEVTQTIAKSISSVSDLTARQVSAVNAATASTKTVAAGIDESAATLQTAAQKTEDAVNAAKSGTDTIDGAVRQMNNIEETVTQLADVVSKLGERSKEIGQIVDTISGIAGQTNLLALNAAIEAARAGEMGKGFAVVAEEVRKLAEQSREAAKEIEKLIGEIQADTEQAVVSMDKGTQEVKAGAGVVRQAGTAFTAIYDMVDAVNRQALDLSRAMETLASGTNQVVESVQTIDDSSKNIADESQSVSASAEEQSASMQQIAASSRSLAELAQDLTKLSNQFRI